MFCYKKAQNNLRIEQENLPTRTRVYLMNGEQQVGKLTLQTFPVDKKYYYLTHFKIEPEYRSQGWGTKMMNTLLANPEYQDRPIVVHPEPYGGEIGTPEYNQEIENLNKMYEKFGFENQSDEDYDMGYMVLNRE